VKLRDFLLVLRTRWLIVVGCILVVTGVAAALTYSQTPLYTAQSKFYLAAKPNSSQKDAIAYVVTPQDLNTYVAVLGSPTVMDPLRASLTLSPQDPINVSAGATGETAILQVTAVDPDPARAAEIANKTGDALAGAADEFTTLLRDTGTEIEAKAVTPATTPTVPTSPNPQRNLLLGAFAGLLVGIGIAFVRHTLDTKVREEADIRPFSKEPMLGALPMDKAKTDQVTIDRDPHSGYAEAIRRLRTNLMFVDVTTAKHSFIVTSAMPGEGKTTTTVNLAMAMATTGGKVLLIDGDLRNPSVARTLGIEGGAGLTTVLLGQAGIDDVVQRWRDTSLYVLTSGAIPPNPSELLGSEPMRELFDKLAHEFDFILIDSPPVVPVVDAVLLDRLTGGTLMVVASHKTKKRDLGSAVKQLDTVGAKLVGFALNFVPVSESDARRYGYYRFQETPSSTAAAGKPQKSSRAKPHVDAKGRRVAKKSRAKSADSLDQPL
jgi:capsular exopolysaccharide synthesis family protein